MSSFSLTFIVQEVVYKIVESTNKASGGEKAYEVVVRDGGVSGVARHVNYLPTEVDWLDVRTITT